MDSSHTSMRIKLIFLVGLLGLIPIVASGLTKHNFALHKDQAPIDVRSFGAIGDGVNDDTSAIQSAINYCVDNSTVSATLYFPGLGGNSSNNFYRITDTLTIRSIAGAPFSRFVSLIGDSPNSSRIFYTGTDYKDVIHLDGTVGNISNFSMKNLGIFGGMSRTTAYARYCLYMTGVFGRHCVIERCTFQYGTGLIYSSGPAYSIIRDCRFQDTVASYPTGGVDTSFVNGDNSSPIFFNGIGGNTTFEHNAISLVGLDPAVGTTVQAVYLRNNACNYHNNSIESIINRSGTGSPRNCNYILRCSGVVDFNGLYMELVDANDAIIKVDGNRPCGTTFSNCELSDMISYWLFQNVSGGDVIFRDSFIASISIPILFSEVYAYGGYRTNTEFHNSSVVAGIVSQEASPSYAWYADTGAFSINRGLGEGGCRDGIKGSYWNDYITSPRVLSGYIVSTGTDAIGMFVKVTPGRFMHSNGNIVQSYWAGSYSATATSAYQLLRFSGIEGTRRNKYYQVVVGYCGQPYLNRTASSAQETGSSTNYITEFYVDGSDGIATLTPNPRLSYYGSFIGRNEILTLLFIDDGVTPSGYWATGTIAFNIANAGATLASAGKIVTVGGATPTWKTFGPVEP